MKSQQASTTPTSSTQAVPAPSSADDLSSDSLKALLFGSGAVIVKVSDGGKVAEKKLCLSNDRAFLTYYPSVKERDLACTALDIILDIKKIVAPKKPHPLPPGHVGLLIQRTGGKTWNFLVPDAHADVWVSVLSEVTGVTTRQSNAMDPQQQRAIKLWRAADRDGDGHVTESEFMHCLSRINFARNVELRDRVAIFHKFLEDNSETLDYIGFSALYASISKRDHLKELFKRFAQSHAYSNTSNSTKPVLEGALTEGEFKEFLSKCQAENPSRQALRTFFSTISRGENMSYDAFSRFLLRPDLNPALAPWAGFEVDDMTKPFAHYYINSWHVKCSGSQAGDMETVQAALLAGCRYVEIECFDGSDNEPVAFSQTPLEIGRVLAIMSVFAFRSSKFPVIVRLKDRTSQAQSLRLRSVVAAHRDAVQLEEHDLTDSITPSTLMNKLIVRFHRSLESGEASRGVLDFLGTPHFPTINWAKGEDAEPRTFRNWNEAVRINDGLFSLNGRCGYVLKPLYLRGDSTSIKPTEKFKLNITVILASQIPKANDSADGFVIDPYVRLKLHGDQEDEDEKECCTETVDGNGFSPVWNESFSMTVHNLELALLSVRVVDAVGPKVLRSLIGPNAERADTDICEGVIPVRALRRGYRSVGQRLCTTGDNLPSATVLCHFNIEKI